jgi:hypothetical protein
MRTSFLFSVIASLALFNGSVSAFQLFQRRGITWADPKPNQAVRLNGSEITEELDPSTLVRRDYIKRKTDKEPILFYTHHRSIIVTVGNRGQTLLINDYEASKSSKVIAISLATNQARQIDLAAIEMYRRNASPDGRLWVVPDAYAFSPDDMQVLMNMELIDISASHPEETVRARRTYKGWWYVVDANTGGVRQEYRTKRVPRRWWRP